MKIFCCYTQAHKTLLENYFSRSLPAGFSVTSIELDIAGPGDYLSPEFLQCISRKVDLILQSIEENSDEIVIWSDIDIQFFDLQPEMLVNQLGNHDIAFQREGHRVTDVNTGFIVCRCNRATAAFFRKAKDGLKQIPTANEQLIINALLRQENCEVSWTYLSPGFYARSHGWPPPRNIVLYHANNTAGSNGVRRKIEQFDELSLLRRHRVLGLLFLFPKYALRKFVRLSRKCLTMPSCQR